MPVVPATNWSVLSRTNRNKEIFVTDFGAQYGAQISELEQKL